MKRGDIVTISTPGDYGKLRPAIPDLPSSSNRIAWTPRKVSWFAQ
jgi:hypothetical protein